MPPAEIERRDDLARLSARRWRVALTLTSIMLTTYFAFLLLVAWNKEALGTQLAPGLSVGILLGALVIVLAWALTGIYVMWANRHYDAALDRLRAERPEGGS